MRGRGRREDMSRARGSRVPRALPGRDGAGGGGEGAGGSREVVWGSRFGVRVPAFSGSRANPGGVRVLVCPSLEGLDFGGVPILGDLLVVLGFGEGSR